MTIRANNWRLPITPRPAVLAGLALALVACQEKPSQTSHALAAEADQSSCLLVVWADQTDPDTEFDQANDAVKGGAISCATRTSPSQFRDAIAAIRTASDGPDRKAMLEQIGVPLLYIDREGQRRQLPDEAAVNTLFEEIFDDSSLAVLRDLDMKDMTVAPDQGGFFQLGSIWLAVPEPGARPRIVTVNHQALAEAEGAARGGDQSPT